MSNIQPVSMILVKEIQESNQQVREMERIANTLASVRDIMQR